MDKNLNWTKQVTETCKKIYSILHALKRLKNFLPFKLKKLVIQTLIIPYFDYCDVLLTDLNASLTQKLQRVHNVCVRYVCDIKRADHVTSSFKKITLGPIMQEEMGTLINTSTPSP